MKKLLAAALLAALLLTVMAPVAFAGGLLDDKVIFGDEFTLKDGETVDGDLIVFGGDVTLEEGSVVTGDVIIYGGDFQTAGQIDGDVVVYGGNADIQSAAAIEGTLATWGGHIDRDPDATIRGGEVSGSGNWIDIPRPPFLRGLPRLRVDFYPLAAAVQALLWASSLAALALLVLLFWPDQTARVGQAVALAPIPSGGLGLLTAILALPLGVLLVVTICLSPVALVGWLALFAAVLYGWIALGTLVGNRLAGALKMTTASPAVTGAIGTFILTITTTLLNIIPCLGAVISALLASLGLGAVILTRFGRRGYLPPLSPPTPAPETTAGA